MKAYKLENLSCAHCASSIEQALETLDCVTAVRLQFATLDLHLETTDLAAVKRTINSIEPEVRLVDPSVEPSGESKALRAWIWLTPLSLVLGGLLAAEALLGWEGWGVQAAYAVLYLAAGLPVLRLALGGLQRGQWFDENFLMAFATLAAWLVGAGAEAVSVMVFYQWGEFLQDHAVNRSRRSLGALLASKPRLVRRVDQDGRLTEVDPASVESGLVFEVRAGEQIPLDGQILSGTGSIDTGILTGESLPRGVAPGDEVAAGSMNLDAVLRLRCTRPFAQSAWAGVVASVDAALAKKAPLERFITRFARVYTPVVLLLALGLFSILSVTGTPWHDSLYRSLVLLVISCPCALVLSIPLTYLGAIGAASRRGLLVRDAGALDRIAKVNALAFDKTGTLTEGVPRVLALRAHDTEEKLRDCLSQGFAVSSHPLARAWITPIPGAQDAQETRGMGVSFSWQGERVAMGKKSFLSSLGFPSGPHGEDQDTTVHTATSSTYLGCVTFEDPSKPDTTPALEQLRALGFSSLALLSGDVPAVVEKKGQEWGISSARGGLLPQDKLNFVEDWESEGKRVLFVGDGMNDAPVLARASVGVSLGAGASAAAIETADVAILDASPLQVVRLIRLGRRTRILLYQNIGLALGLKAIFMVLGGLGLAGLWEAVFADVGVALLAVANSLRAGKGLV